LKLSRPISLADVMLLNIADVKSLANHTIRENAYPIKTLASVQEFKDQLDSENDGVHMDDIVHFMETNQDITGDNLFDTDDIRYLLEQI
jgi:hypothetical protein